MNFDVVITSYKRAELVLAAVQSCRPLGELLRRVIVVDDCSGDETVAALKALDWDRLQILVHRENQGIAGARATGFAASAADWTISLDSDHELHPHALEVFARLARAHPECSALGARYLWDTGRVTPEQVPAGVIGYRERVENLGWGTGIFQDYVCCVRRDAREAVRWENVRGSVGDTLFQLDLYRFARVAFSAEVVALQKSSLVASNSRGAPFEMAARRRRDAAGFVAGNRLLLERHGEAIRCFNPPHWRDRAAEELLYRALSSPRGLQAWSEALGCWRRARTVKATALFVLVWLPPFVAEFLLGTRIWFAQKRAVR